MLLSETLVFGSNKFFAVPSFQPPHDESGMGYDARKGNAEEHAVCFAANIISVWSEPGIQPEQTNDGSREFSRRRARSSPVSCAPEPVSRHERNFC